MSEALAVSILRRALEGIYRRGVARDRNGLYCGECLCSLGEDKTCPTYVALRALAAARKVLVTK
jgi:hypothetical protein